MPWFEVAVVYKGQDNYIVEADSKEEAEEIAELKWKANENPDILGNEWEDIHRVIAYPCPQETS